MNNILVLLASIFLGIVINIAIFKTYIPMLSYTPKYFATTFSIFKMVFIPSHMLLLIPLDNTLFVNMEVVICTTLLGLAIMGFFNIDKIKEKYLLKRSYSEILFWKALAVIILFLPAYFVVTTYQTEDVHIFNVTVSTEIMLVCLLIALYCFKKK